tara:strand:- start:3168 stop:3431 length:264 start_codon:yes stop_codon:yes gene_type:complete
MNRGQITMMPEGIIEMCVELIGDALRVQDSLDKKQVVFNLQDTAELYLVIAEQILGAYHIDMDDFKSRNAEEIEYLRNIGRSTNKVI